jgi:hypothetical protein
VVTWPGRWTTLTSVRRGLVSRGNLALWSVNINGGELRQVVDDKYIGPDFVIAPDRRSVYFTSIRTEGIWRVALPADGEAPPVPQATGLQTAGATTAQLTMSSDGRRIGLTTTDTSNHVWARRRRAGGLGRGGVTQGSACGTSPAPASDGRCCWPVRVPGRSSRSSIRDAAALTTHRPRTAAVNGWRTGWSSPTTGGAYWALRSTGRERCCSLSELRRVTPVLVGAWSINILARFQRLAMGFVKDGRRISGGGLKNLRPDGSLIR